MAALAYLLPPLSGLVAYFASGSERVRWHGLQSVALGVVWPVGLFGAALVSPGLTQAVALVGGALWLALLVSAAVGRDPSLPVAGSTLRALAQEPPR